MGETRPHSALAYLAITLVSVSALFLIPWIAGYGFADADAIAFYYPAFSFFSSALRAGASPVWSPYFLSGFPLSADLIGGFSHPFAAFLYALLPNFVHAYHALFLIHVLVAAACVYGLAYTLGVSARGSWVAALTFSASQWVLMRGAIPPVSFSLPLLPGLLLSLEYAMTKSWKWLALGIYVLGTALLAGHAQLVLLSVTAAAAWMLARRKVHHASFARIAVLLAAVCVAGLIIGAPYFVPAYRLQQLSERNTTLPLAVSQHEGLSLLDPVRLMFPSAELLFPWLSSSESFLFVGALPLLLILLAAMQKPATPAARLIKTALLIALLASVVYSPLSVALHYLPLFGWFRVPSRWLYVALSFAALLAGHGADLIRTPVPHRAKLVRLALCALGLGVSFSLALSLFTEPLIQIVKAVHQTLAAAEIAPKLSAHAWSVFSFLVRTLRDSIALSNPKVLATLALWGMGLWFVRSAPRMPEEKSSRLFAALILAGSLASVIMLPVLVQRSEITRPSPITQFVSQHMQAGYRVFSYLGKEALWEREIQTARATTQESVAWHNASLHTNTGQLFGIPMTSGYSAVATERQRIFASELGTTWMIPLRDQRAIRLNPEPHLNTLMNLLRMSSTQYIVSPYALSHPLLIEQLALNQPPMPLYLYELADPYPHVFAPQYTLCAHSQSDAWNKVLALPTSSLWGIIEAGECSDAGAHKTTGSVTISDVDTKPGMFSFWVDASEPQWVVVNESYVPGWHGSIDGRETALVPANFLYQAMRIPQGAHRITLEFKGVGR